MASLEISIQLGCGVTSQHRQGVCYLGLQVFVEGLQQDGPCAAVGKTRGQVEQPSCPARSLAAWVGSGGTAVIQGKCDFHSSLKLLK